MPMTMTCKEFLSKYGHVEVKFNSYYKYVFGFAGPAEDGTVQVYVCIGGDASDIYRIDVDADKTTTIAQLVNEHGMSSGTVTKDGRVIEISFP